MASCLLTIPLFKKLSSIKLPSYAEILPGLFSQLNDGKQGEQTTLRTEAFNSVDSANTSTERRGVLVSLSRFSQESTYSRVSVPWATEIGYLSLAVKKCKLGKKLCFLSLISSIMLFFSFLFFLFCALLS